MKKIFFTHTPNSNALRQHETVQSLLASEALAECNEAVRADIVVVSSSTDYSTHRRDNDPRTFLFVSPQPETVLSGTQVGTASALAAWLSNWLADSAA